ncbi:aldo/keto reductase [Rubrobacter tropicus]|uniref:aldo/keto reductase n=1 Tax=Rubrobacter tropicus TaxID=2653851 RepID=UPI002B1BD1C1|nr:aldo/keto reductase [Rubrobacter tropicus]
MLGHRGPIYRGGKQRGWGEVDDGVSIRAVHQALEMGVNFVDTAAVYGAGHSERVLARALEGKRDEVVIATKFGMVFDEETKEESGRRADRDSVRRECEASLRRLGTDRIDLYQLHIGDLDLERVPEVLGVLEELVDDGKIRAYGWSTDDPDRARAFAEGFHCAAMQQRLNVLEGNEETLAVCEQHDLASLNRGPLGMGLLTGKFDRDTSLPETDVRSGWDFREGDAAERLERLQNIRDVLTSDGRTLAQGALGWLWARSKNTVPIPGFKTVEQIEENADALQFGPLTDGQMEQIEDLISR